MRAAAALAVLGLVACAPRGDPRLVGGLDGGGRDAGEIPVDLRQAPPRPTVADSADGPDIAFGLREVLLEQGAAWENIGLDLDGYRTVPGDLASECIAGGATQRDGLDGIDNVFGHDLYPLIESAVPGLEARARAAGEEGRGLPILYVRGWNGTPDDPQVDIAIVVSVFATSVDGVSPDMPPDVIIRSPIDYELASGGALPRPLWDGDDWAWVRDDAFLAGDFAQPLIRDDNAYVADGVFVARLPARIDIIFPADDIGVLMRFTGATIFGGLNADGLNLDTVTVGGRWSVTDLLSTAENIGICRGTGQYELLAGQLDRIADVRSIPPPRGEPGLTCNAVSIGVTFRGTRLRVAGVTPGLPLVNLCAIEPDAGIPDAGVRDAGRTDAGSSGGLDAGASDAP